MQAQASRIGMREDPIGLLKNVMFKVIELQGDFGRLAQPTELDWDIMHAATDLRHTLRRFIPAATLWLEELRPRIAALPGGPQPETLEFFRDWQEAICFDSAVSTEQKVWHLLTLIERAVRSTENGGRFSLRPSRN